MRSICSLLMKIVRVSATVVFVLVLLPSARAAGGRESVLYNFQGQTDGADPIAGLVADAAGNLYGTTSAGGNGSCQGGCGTVFELSPNGDGTWTETQLYSFLGGTDGAFPNAGVVFDQGGNLYGTTIHGGATGDGAVFRLSPPSPPGGAWTETILYNFVGSRDGEYCIGGLTFDSAGNLYGAGLYGGRYGGGTVFQLMPAGQGNWSLNVLHSFKGTNDGIDPLGPMIVDKAGIVYGMTYDGTAFSLTPPARGQVNWTIKALYHFGAIAGVGALLHGGSGGLYGTTALGGATNNGTIFQLTPSTQKQPAWMAVTLYEFQGGNDGGFPLNGLVADGSGNLYGVSTTGGAFNAGTVFRLSPPGQQGGMWTKTTLHDFQGGNDGAGPGSGVIFAGQKTLYGTTGSGGSSNNGTVFQVGR